MHVGQQLLSVYEDRAMYIFRQPKPAGNKALAGEIQQAVECQQMPPCLVICSYLSCAFMGGSGGKRAF